MIIVSITVLVPAKSALAVTFSAKIVVDSAFVLASAGDGVQAEKTRIVMINKVIKRTVFILPPHLNAI